MPTPGHDHPCTVCLRMYNTTQYVYISTYIQMFAAQIELRVVLHTYLSLLSGTIRYLLSAHDEEKPNHAHPYFYVLIPP